MANVLEERQSQLGQTRPEQTITTASQQAQGRIVNAKSKDLISFDFVQASLGTIAACIDRSHPYATWTKSKHDFETSRHTYDATTILSYEKVLQKQELEVAKLTQKINACATHLQHVFTGALASAMAPVTVPEEGATEELQKRVATLEKDREETRTKLRAMATKVQALSSSSEELKRLADELEKWTADKDERLLCLERRTSQNEAAVAEGGAIHRIDETRTLEEDLEEQTYGCATSNTAEPRCCYPGMHALMLDMFVKIMSSSVHIAEDKSTIPKELLCVESGSLRPGSHADRLAEWSRSSPTSYAHKVSDSTADRDSLLGDLHERCARHIASRASEFDQLDQRLRRLEDKIDSTIFCHPDISDYTEPERIQRASSTRAPESNLPASDQRSMSEEPMQEDGSKSRRPLVRSSSDKGKRQGSAPIPKSKHHTARIRSSRGRIVKPKGGRKFHVTCQVDAGGPP